MKRLILLLVIFFCLTGCEDILDCIINVRPELPDKTFKIGHINEFYHDELLAGINNESQDDLYNYYFTDTGNIPEGLIMYYDFRTVVIEGTPLTSGEYRFTLNLKVEYKDTYYDVDGNYEDGNLCDDETSNSYVIKIN